MLHVSIVVLDLFFVILRRISPFEEKTGENLSLELALAVDHVVVLRSRVEILLERAYRHEELADQLLILAFVDALLDLVELNSHILRELGALVQGNKLRFLAPVPLGEAPLKHASFYFLVIVSLLATSLTFGR